jgi:hypothetical protein
VPLRIQDSLEPYDIYPHDDESILAESDASRLLRQELERYLDKRVGGRSFLIAGHRGAGKTTAVLDAVRREYEISLREGPPRPLFVPLHGPSLLPNLADIQPAVAGAAEPKKKADGAADDSSKPAQTKPLGRTQNALIQITLGLYHAVAKEITRAFRERVREQASGANYLPGPFRAELAELAAQLELELDDFPDPARLREFWRRAGSLDSGVLFDAEHVPAFDQGLRELIALVSVNKAFQRIEADLKGQRTDISKQNAIAEASAEGSVKLSELVGPIVSLITGGIVTGGVAAGGQLTSDRIITAGVAGIVASLAAATVMKYSSKSTRERSTSWEYTLVRNFELDTLDRVLPVLTDRLREAGLAPVFVVDELDKVENISQRMPDIVKHLKQFVAERSFFCFLTNRSYYESLRRRLLDEPYPREHTYFSQPLFVAIRPHDLHEYLLQVIQKDNPSPEDDEDYQVLPYVLRFQAQAHASDLQRRLAQIRGPNGMVNLAPGAVRTRPDYVAAALIQLGIEMVLDQGEMRRELESNPETWQVAYDAMYYIPRRWLQGEETVDLNETPFELYLAGRIKEDVDNSPPGTESNGHSTVLDVKSRLLLLNGARRLAALLADPDRFRTEFHQYQSELRTRNRPEVDSALWNALLDNPTEMKNRQLLEPEPQNVYRWRFSPSGRSLVPLEAILDASLLRQKGLEHAKLIRVVADAISEVSEGKLDLTLLSAELHVIPTSPAWSEVSAALDRIAGFKEFE